MDRSILSIIVVMGALVGVVLFLISQPDEPPHETKSLIVVLPKSRHDLSLSGVFLNEIKVVIGLNNTILWKNEDTISHNVELPTDERFYLIESGSSFSYTFENAGVFDYVIWPGINGYDESFKGKIIVSDLSKPPAQRISVLGIYADRDSVAEFDKPTHVRIKDLIPKASALFFYPYSGSKTLDGDLRNAWTLIRLPEKYGGYKDDISSFRAYSMVDLHLGCIIGYWHDKEVFVDPCHGTMYEVLNGIPLNGPGKDYTFENNALPQLDLGIDVEGYIYVKSPIFDIDKNGMIGYGRRVSADAATAPVMESRT